MTMWDATADPPAHVPISTMQPSLACSASSYSRRISAFRVMPSTESMRAMLAGCAISLVSAALAGGLLIAAAADTPQARMQRGFLAMIVRLVAVIVLGIAAALSGEFQRSPLLFWMATAYVALLPLEVRLAIL